MRQSRSLSVARPLVGLLLAAAAIGLVGSATAWSRSARSLADGSSAAFSVPPLAHVVVIVFENHERSDILTSREAPTFRHLAGAYAQATAYQAVAHPSSPTVWRSSPGRPTASRTTAPTARRPVRRSERISPPPTGRGRRTPKAFPPPQASRRSTSRSSTFRRATPRSRARPVQSAKLPAYSFVVPDSVTTCMTVRSRQAIRGSLRSSRHC